MNLELRIDAFVKLGLTISSTSSEVTHELFDKAIRGNAWFTPENVTLAFKGITKFLDKEALTQWTSSHDLENLEQKTIGVAMAGNIPLVGFHDFLCVLIAGHRLKAKLSSQDSVLLSHLADQLIKIEPSFGEAIQFSERLLDIDAMIATGSDNTARYFEYYFRNVPHIIRKNRSSCAVLSGKETESELNLLGADVFSYFGLGCRNVSKLYLPKNYDVTLLLRAWTNYGNVVNHNKYFNNYEYQKSILLVNQVPFFDNGFVLMKEDSELVSPISVLYFEFYDNPNDLLKKLDNHRTKIQCILSANTWVKGSEELGQAQFPSVSDYADQEDTLKFLSEI